MARAGSRYLPDSPPAPMIELCQRMPGESTSPRSRSVRTTLTSARHRLARVRAARMLAAAAMDRRRRPLFIGWSLTDHCNRSCSYCGRPERALVSLGAERALTLADEMAEAGVLRVSLTGGEPLLHPACLPVAERLAGHGISVSLNTNGSLVPEQLPRLRAVLSSMVVSLDGDRETHDLQRGAGSWNEALEGVRAAREAGIDVALHMVLTARNLDQVAVVLELAGGFGCKVGFSPLEEVPAMGRRELDDLWPGAAQWQARVDGLLRRKRRGDRRIQNSQAGLRYLRNWPRHAPIRCSAGQVYARIEPDGSLYGCGNLVRRGGAPTLANRPFASAFAALPDMDCRACWCDTRVEMNLILAGSPSAIWSAWSR